MSRPCLEFTSQELEQLALEHWGSTSALLALADELRFRNMPKAQRLGRKIAGRLTDLGITSDGSGSGTDRRDSSQAAEEELQLLWDQLSRSAQQLRASDEELARAKVELAQARAGAATPDATLWRRTRGR